MRRITLSFAVFLLPLLIPHQAMAWGPVAHEAICEIAVSELTPAAQTKVQALMEFDSEFRLFSKSCNWLDNPRKRPREHFANVSRNVVRIEKTEGNPCPIGNKCVMSAILNDMRDLALVNDEEEQLRLLKSLGHWLGDMHQPLHISFEDDRGGNKIDVDAPCSSNLHAVLDSCIVEEKIGEDPGTIALELRAEISSAERAAWIPASINTQAVIGWANESLAISLKADVGYCVQKDGVCQYSAEQKEYVSGQPLRKVVADDAYLSKHAPAVAERIKMAGVRLGAMLNAIFSPIVTAAGESAPARLPQLDLPEPRSLPASPTPDRVTVNAEDFRGLSQRIDRLEQTIALLTDELARLRRGARR